MRYMLIFDFDDSDAKILDLENRKETLWCTLNKVFSENFYSSRSNALSENLEFAKNNLTVYSETLKGLKLQVEELLI